MVNKDVKNGVVSRKPKGYLQNAAAVFALGIGGFVFGKVGLNTLEKAEQREITAAEAEALYPVTLAYGSKLVDVAIYQGELERAGYPVGISGVFDHTTVSVTSRFQRENGLPATGEADAQTRRAVHNAGLMKTVTVDLTKPGSKLSR